MIFELNNNGTSVIFSTHRMESVEQLCDHIAMIHQAEKILDGSKQEIKETYRDGTYRIEYKGDIATSPNFEIRSTEETGRGLKSSIIQYETDANPNELLKNIINQVEIHSFVERIPSMNDIFISQVKGGNHE